VELTKKTTILLPPELHQQLTDLAARRGTSLGALVREACTVTYGLVDQEARLAAADALGALSLPVDEPSVMKRESVPMPKPLRP
jgi:predicted DNA-binding protein